LGIAGCGEREDSQSEKPAMFEELFHRNSLCTYSNCVSDQAKLEGRKTEVAKCRRRRVLRDKKRRHERFAVRAGRPVTQLTSNSGVVSLPAPSLEYIHHSIDSVEVKYKNRNFIWGTASNLFSMTCI
jgi:hypothetical protein